MSRYSTLATAPRGDIVVVEEDVSVLESRVATLETAVANGGGGVGVTQNELTVVSDKVDQNEVDIQSLTATLTTNIQTVNTSVDLLQTDITNINGSITTATTERTNIQNSLNATNQDVTDLENDLTGVSTTVNGVSATVSTLQGDVTTIDTSVTTLQGSVTTNTQDLDTLETIVRAKIIAYVGAGGSSPKNIYSLNANFTNRTANSGALSNVSDDVVNNDSFAVNWNTAGDTFLLAYEFTGTPPIISEYVLWSRASNNSPVHRRDEMLRDWELHGAASKTAYEQGTYEVLDAHINVDDNDWGVQTYSTSSPKYAHDSILTGNTYKILARAYAYYVLYITDNNGASNLGLGEWALRGPEFS